MIIMGRIVAPYGVYGWVKIQPHTEVPDGLLDYGDWWLGRDGQWQQYELEAGKMHGAVLLAKLKGISDRDMAFALKGKQISVPRSHLPAPEEDEYYWTDLIGLQVINLQNVELGKIDNIFETGANDVLVVKGERERLIPFVGQVVLDVNLETGVMRVDWDAGF
jgi:16S rRNA processing protein RimM